MSSKNDTPLFISKKEHLDAQSPLYLGFKDMPVDEQPREKIIRQGVQSLSDAELLAVLLRTGSKGLHVVDTARLILHKFNGLGKMSRKSWQELKSVHGIGKVKAITLEALFELSRRIEMSAFQPQPLFDNPDSVAAYFGPLLRDLRKEVFVVAFLNNAKRMTGYKKISIGTSTGTLVEPQEVMKQAIMNDANSIILLHNHPSGNARASDADIRITQKIVQSGKILSITVDDHIIIAGKKSVSMRALGYF